MSGLKVVVYPADQYGCGNFRMILPAQALIDQGHDVTIVLPGNRGYFTAGVDKDGVPRRVSGIPEGTDVVVMQRVAHSTLSQCIPLMRAQGVAVVVDMDDDLSCIHPSNPAYMGLHPNASHPFSWQAAANACRDATLVTTTTRALESRYLPLTRASRVIDNYVPDHYLRIPHEPFDGTFGYAGSLHSHPDDVPQVGGAVRTLVDEGHEFRVVGSKVNEDGEAVGFADALNLPQEPRGTGGVHISEWPYQVARLGVGMAPLSDTAFNAAKSRLKVLEMSALGVPWVASPRGEYSTFHARYKTGILAKRPREWTRALRSLLTDEALRKEQIESGWAAVQGQTYADNAWRWMEAWDHAFRVQRGYVRTGVR